MKIESKYNVGDFVFIRRLGDIFRCPILDVKISIGAKWEYKIKPRDTEGWYQERVLSVHLHEMRNNALLFLQRMYIDKIEELEETCQEFESTVNWRKGIGDEE